MRIFLKIVGIVLGVIVVMALAFVGVVRYEFSDEKLTENVQELLADELGTKVSLKQAKLHPFQSELAIYGLDIKDRKNVDMLQIDTLESRINFFDLLENELMIYSFKLHGATANLYKETKTSAANYQFAIDSLTFAGDKKEEATKDKKNKSHIYLDLRKVSIARTSVKWNVHSADSLNVGGHKELDLNHLWVENFKMEMSLHGGGAPGNFVGKMKSLSVDERNSETAVLIRNARFNGKKGELSIKDIDLKYQDKHLRVNNLGLKASLDATNKGNGHLVLENICFENGIGLPKKERKPWLGKFDGTHMNLEASLEASATVLSADSLDMKIEKLQARDKNSDFHIDDITMNIAANPYDVNVKDLTVCSNKTKVYISGITAHLPKYGKDKRSWSFRSSTVKVDALLKDISQPLAPALKNFTTPLHATCTATGNPKRITLDNIHAYNTDKRVQVFADGVILLPKVKGEKATLEFDIHSMKAVRGIKDQIIRHFPLKAAALNFIRNLGNVTYKGKLLIPYKHTGFVGTIGTRYGTFDVNIDMNSITRYMKGSLKTNQFRLGEYIGNDNIGDVSLKANVNMDIMGKEVARYYHKKMSKIPKGTLSGRAIEASYMGIKIKNVDFNIVSNGTGAHGTLSATNKLGDISCDFSFTDATDIKHTLKVKPHFKLWLFSKKKSEVTKR